MTGMLPVRKIYTDDDKNRLFKKLRLRFAIYWVCFFAFIAIAGESGSQSLGLIGLLAFVIANLMLSMSVADAAAADGGSGPIWGMGAFFLGPFGALLFGGMQLLKLRTFKKG